MDAGLGVETGITKVIVWHSACENRYVLEN